MRISVFLSFILILALGWMQFYSSARHRFNGVKDLQLKLEHVEKLREREQVEYALDREQFLDFHQYVASLMPDVLKEHGQGVEGYALRGLASVVTKPAVNDVRGTIIKTLFERGKEHFRNKEYAKAKRIFRQIIERYGFSPYVAESYFLLAESHFQENEYEECVSVIQAMIEQFPAHELTGFAMVRLGRIYESQNRGEQAVDIYKTVIRSFPQRDVASQAKASLRGLAQ